MATRTNLCPNPALKVDATGWFGPTTPTAWARTTTANAGLPRTTAFAGSSVGNVAPRRGTVTPGLTYRLSGYIYNAAAVQQDITVNANWYTAGAFTSASPGMSYSIPPGTVMRVHSGRVVAPAGVNETLLAINGLDGAAEITGLLYEQSTNLNSYFDGDTAGATWTGTNGSSTSTITVGTQSFTGTETFTVAEKVPETGRLTEKSVLTKLTYDDLRGRVRISSFGFDPSVVRAVVYAKADNQARFTEVRGGKIAVENGDFLRPVDHYEFAAGLRTTYKIVGLSSPEGSPDVVVQEAVVARQDSLEDVWLKFIAMPFLNRKITLAGWGEIGRQSRNGEFNVIGRVDPVVVTDVHSSRRTTITALTRDSQETDELDLALAQGAPVYLHVPTHCALPTMYAVIGDYSHHPVSPRSQRSLFDISITEVGAPPLSLFGATMTCQLLVNTYASCQEVLDTYDTCQGVVD